MAFLNRSGLSRGSLATPVNGGLNSRAAASPASPAGARSSEYRNMEASIRYLTGILPEKWTQIVEAACWANLRINPRLERSVFRVNATPHVYGPNNTEICDGARGALVFEEMCRDGRCSAPTFSEKPIYSGKIETLWPFDDQIVKLVDLEERTVYNVTVPKHILFPGYVKLTVVESRDKTSVAVSGRGEGNWKWANTTFGPVLFETILHQYLAHNVERRLHEPDDFKGGGGSDGGAGAGGRW